MKNRILLVFLALVLAVSMVTVGACAPEEAPPAAPAAAPPAAEPAVSPAPPAWEWPPMLTAVAPSIMVSAFRNTLAWTPLHEGDTGVKWRASAESSGGTVTRWLKAGEIDFWITALSVPSNCLEGSREYGTREGGPFPLRVAWINDFGMGCKVVRGDSDIKTIYDIKPGAKYGVYAGSPFHALLYRAYRAYLDMTEEELINVPFGDDKAACRAVVEGKVDMASTMSTSAIAYEMAASPHGIRFLEFPEENIEGEKRYRAVLPCGMFGTVDFGVKEGQGVRAEINPWCYYTLSDTDAELVYRLAKWLHENFDAYKDLNESCPQMSIENFRDALDLIHLPVHEGTIRYLKEIGMWTAADDARQKYNVSLVTRYTEAYETAIAMADKEGISVNPKNKDWTELWSNYKKEIGLPRFRILSDEEITAELTKLK